MSSAIRRKFDGWDSKLFAVYGSSEMTSCVVMVNLSGQVVRSNAIKTARHGHSNPEQNAVCHIQLMQVVYHCMMYASTIIPCVRDNAGSRVENAL